MKYWLMGFVLVFLGGGLGSMLRYYIGLICQKSSPSLPWATFFANTLACLIFSGVLWYLSSKELAGSHLRLLLLTGFCGGLSTFSSFGYETYLLFKVGYQLYALLNVIVSTGLCLLIFYAFNRA